MLHFQDWAFWLNRGSEVKVEYEVEQPGVYFVLLKGPDNFKRWLKNPRDLGAAEYHTFAAGKHLPRVESWLRALVAVVHVRVDG